MTWAPSGRNLFLFFSEMGSVNPVFAFPEYLAANPQTLAAQYIGSLTLGVGQFCTNPGVFLAVSGEAFQAFKLAVSAEINNISEAKMLHEGIQKAYDHGKHKLTGQPEVSLLATGQVGTATLAQAAVFVTTGKAF